MESRGQKFFFFLGTWRALSSLGMSKARGGFLQNYYLYHRFDDDVIDGDYPLPKHCGTPLEFIESKIEFARTLSNPRDWADELLVTCYELASQFNEDFRYETDCILQSLAFDAGRVGKNRLYPEEDLLESFHRLDIEGTVRAMLKVHDESQYAYDAIEPLALATRIFYNLRDLAEDLAVGYVNIPQESMSCNTDIGKLVSDSSAYLSRRNELDRRYAQLPRAEKLCKFKTYRKVRHLYEAQYVLRLPDDVGAWFRQEMVKGLEYVDEHHKMLKEADLHFRTRLILKALFEPGLRLYLGKMEHTLT
jgi:hypothetical protein